MQMILDLTTSYGYTVVVVVCIVGFVMEKQEGNGPIAEGLIYYVWLFLMTNA